MNFEIAPKETEVQLNWDDACLYCFSLNIDGKTGWRLPTQEELNEMFESDNNVEERGWYWTTTGYIGNYRWVQEFYNGMQYGKHGVYYVRAIREI